MSTSNPPKHSEIEEGVVWTVKTYKYKFNKDSYVEVEIENKTIKSIDVYMISPSKGELSYYENEYFSIRQTKQFEQLVEVFNKIIKDFYL